MQNKNTCLFSRKSIASSIIRGTRQKNTKMKLVDFNRLNTKKHLYTQADNNHKAKMSKLLSSYYTSFSRRA